ncbi:MAG: FAD-dependent oxidoreductase, partial [Verrucomicrobiae bacterium]|nr:FAD-dependent oxidoreductase [Verrucomicrobiae bacterium]
MQQPVWFGLPVGHSPGKVCAMRRDLNRLANTEFDLLVIGGGILGAGIARDAALRGLRVALVEKGDFGHATTAASSKLIHGGLRYLRYLQFGVVRDSLRERRVWADIAPHMLDPVMFIMPFSRARRRQLLEMHAVLTAYDLLAFDRNRLSEEAKYIPRHLRLGRAEAIALEPSLAPLDLDGAMTFTDYQMYSPERLALECVLDAAARRRLVAYADGDARRLLNTLEMLAVAARAHRRTQVDEDWLLATL